jgi:short-subunit dehydrogenase
LATLFADKLVVITGGSSGIGRALAYAFASEGARLVLTAINEARLSDAAKECAQLGASVSTYAADVSDFEQMQGLSAKVSKEHGTPDIPINHAGVVMAGDLVSVELEDWRRLFDINVMGVVHGLKLFLPDMTARGSGHVVNVSSAAGLMAPPLMSTYCATKFAVVGLSDSLRREVGRHGIKVTCVCPGTTDTPIKDKVKLAGKASGERGQNRVRAMFDNADLTAEHVAKKTLAGIRKNDPIVLIGKEAQLAWWARRLPSKLTDRLLGRV